MPRFASLTVRLKRLWQRRLRHDDRFWLGVFSLVVALISAGHVWSPTIAVPSLLIVVLLSASFVMGATALIYLEVIIALSFVFMAASGNVVFGQVLGVFASGALVMWWMRFRARHGLAGTQSDTMLLEVRERILGLANIPQLPGEWSAEAVIRPALGASFAGDFAVFADGSGGSLEMALFDVSGKGTHAAARALLLQGAYGGLIGSMPFGEFLPAANSFLLRQHWDEGFATAAHVHINLATGRYLLSLAGHPPAAYFSAGAGTWTTVGTAGDVLGVSSASRFPVDSGVIAPGDALMVYTDGVIEVPGRDLLYGIDKLLGAADLLSARSWRSGVKWMLESLDLGDSDDCAILLVKRVPEPTFGGRSPIYP